MEKENIKYILLKDIGKPMGYCLLIPTTLLISFWIATVFIKNPNKTPDLVITLLGGAVAGLIGFYAAKQAYKEQQRNEEERQKRDTLAELQSEILQNFVHAYSTASDTSTNLREISYPFLKTSAWDNVKKTTSVDTILKEIIVDLYVAYTLIETYNSMCSGFITAKDNCIRHPHTPTLENELKECRTSLNDFLKNSVVKNLDNCKSKLQKIMEKENI